MVMGMISGIIMYSTRNWLIMYTCRQSLALMLPHTLANMAGTSVVPPPSSTLPDENFSIISGRAVNRIGISTMVNNTILFLNTSAHSLATMTRMCFIFTSLPGWFAGRCLPANGAIHQQTGFP